MLPPSTRHLFVERVRINNVVTNVKPDLVLHTGNEVVLSGRREFVIGEPPVFFSDLRKRKRAVHGPKEKAAWTRSGAVALRARRGSA